MFTHNGTKYLRFENFSTTNGPDLRVYLTMNTTELDQEYIDLGKNKATQGNLNYELPDNISLDTYNTVLIWSRAFSVLFGFAQLS